MTDGRRSILVFRPAGLGDFILSAPAFRALRLRFPHHRIVLLTMHSGIREVAAKITQYAGGAANAPWTKLLVPHLIDEVVTIASPRSLADLRDGRRALRPYRVSMIIQMMDVNTPWRRRLKKLLYLALLAGPVRQLGWWSPGTVERGRIPAHDPHVPHHVHGPMHFLKELAGPDAYSDADILFDVRPGQEADDWAAAWAGGLTRGARLVAIAPGAAQPHKSWPTDKFVALARALLAEDETLTIVVVGTADDAAKAEALMAIDPDRVLSLCGRTSIAQSAALFRQCLLVVGNDGGAMHLADAMGSKVVSIVPGLEFPNSIEPWHNRERAVRHPIYCAPCYSFTFCPEVHNRCMGDLPLAAVLAQCRRALDEI